MKLAFPQNPEENIAMERWAQQRIPDTTFGNSQCMAFFEEGVGIGAVIVFYNFRKTDIELAIAEEPGRNWARRDLINMVLRYPFSIGCHRLTVIIRKDNRAARKLAVRIGFKQEGKLRRAAPDKTDMFLYGLLEGENKLERKQQLKKAA